MLTLLIGTKNQGKVDEIRALLTDIDVELISLTDINVDLDVEEIGKTYAENAALKAKAYAQASGMITLADDSGLEVDALDGAPGLYSARYSSRPNATDADRRGYLLENLAEYPRPWGARFICVVALATPEGEPHFYEGICPGEIIPEERGQFGFGYDPIFLVEKSEQTMAELPMEEKNKISHRARAVIGARDSILELFV
ncbi:MAG: RdgB/HAM1 family non-canonical purine NTP pyrophosphatase [Anaerolineales bacterium]|nr:RdgB/HAM1 family non-canonical purine NTP pyrophosphatase [Chloroflexota bacterium]MBL6981014.1 RdgB/HAM1 family non-canonical purine NTP pyrophosphatase [Anaerolineales bacterium]